MAMRPLVRRVKVLLLALLIVCLAFSADAKQRHFDLRVQNDTLLCQLAESTASRYERFHHPSEQIQIHVHGFPRSGTGYLRKQLHSLLPNSTVHTGIPLLQNEGQFIQSVYPRLSDRAAVIRDAKKASNVSFQGQLLYAGDLCLQRATATALVEARERLFDEWYGRYSDPNSMFLIQKSPMMDVLLLERLGVMPVFHVILVRHPLSFRRAETGEDETILSNWLDALAHVLDSLSELESFAIVSYESLVQYHDQMKEELLEVIHSATLRHRTSDDDLNLSRSARRRNLYFHNTQKSYLGLTDEAKRKWKKCISHSKCMRLYQEMGEIFTSFGYGDDDDAKKEPHVIHSPNFGGVLFSSEGDALKRLRLRGGGCKDCSDKTGSYPDNRFIEKVRNLVIH